MSYKRRILITTIFTIRKIVLRSYEEESWIVISKIYANAADCQDGCLRRSRKLLEKGAWAWRVMAVRQKEWQKSSKGGAERHGMRHRRAWKRVLVRSRLSHFHMTALHP